MSSVEGSEHIDKIHTNSSGEHMDYEYAAGMMDADGCFGINPKKRSDGETYKIRIYCKVDQKVTSYFLQELSDEYSVTLTCQPSGVSRVSLCGVDAEHFTKRIRPYLIIKDQIADYILSLRGLTVTKDELRLIRNHLKSLRDDPRIYNRNITDRYIAGFIDGDGWLTASYDKKSGYLQFKLGALSHISQAQTLHLLQERFGGAFSYKKNGTNVTWIIAITKDKLADLAFLSDYLRQKRDRFLFIYGAVESQSNLKIGGATADSNAILHKEFKSIPSGRDG